MRNKIIAVNAVIVLIVGLLAWALVRSSLSSAADNAPQVANDAKHAALAASARLQLDALRAERWLAIRATDPATTDALAKGTTAAQQEAATAQCDAITSAAKGALESAPSLVVIVDAKGRTVGRNGSTLMRGENLGVVYPGLTEALASGHSGSDVWVNKERNDAYLASYAPFRDSQGTVLGAIVIGTTLNDELARVSDATTGRALVLMVAAGGDPQIAAHSTASNPALEAAVGSPSSPAKEAVKGVIVSGHAGSAPAGDVIVGAAPLEGLGGGKRAAIVTALPSSIIENASSLANPVLGAMALGLLLVVVGGWLLGSYISRPIQTLEEGLLMILNGQSDKRFELDHPDLGGLAFRIDQLLNQLMGVEEDTTDEDGRVSMAPSSSVQSFTDAMSVDDKRMAGDHAPEGTMDPAVVAQLAKEPAAQYYARLYKEYIAAKKTLGESTDHITEQAFATRIQGMEKEASAKYGKPVRYQVKASGKEVVLLAIPLP
jgi:hypothetical protein